MKRFYLLLLVSLLSTFHASSQTHFITAGQTQGMIFTDYVPDYKIPVIPYETFPHFHVMGDVNIDINRDSIYDFNVSIITYGGQATSQDVKIQCLNQNAAFTKFDSARNATSGDAYSGYSSARVAKKYLLNDTLINTEDTSWQSDVLIENYGGFGGSWSIWTDYDYGNPYAPYYYFLKIITANDTILGYLHFDTDNQGIVLDFACEGPTSSYLISSTNNLSPSNISISPNPFTNQINISTEEPFQYTITDYSGRLLLSGTSDKTIATETIPAGSYLLTIKNEEVFSVKKMVKAIW